MCECRQLVVIGCQEKELICQLKDVKGVEMEVCECEKNCAEENLICTVQTDKEGKNEQEVCIC